MRLLTAYTEVLVFHDVKQRCSLLIVATRDLRLREMKITYHVAASRDGFIARENGDVSWLEEMAVSPEEAGLAEFFHSIDGLVMGRNTYDFVFQYGSWPYEDKPTWVCTSRDLEPLAGASLIVVGSIDEAVNGAASRGVEHLWLVGGGQLASDFLKKRLITHLTVSEMPIDLGSGIALFADHELDDVACKERKVTKKNGFRQIELVVSMDA